MTAHTQFPFPIIPLLTSASYQGLSSAWLAARAGESSGPPAAAAAAAAVCLRVRMACVVWGWGRNVFVFFGGGFDVYMCVYVWAPVIVVGSMSHMYVHGYIRNRMYARPLLLAPWLIYVHGYIHTELAA